MKKITALLIVVMMLVSALSLNAFAAVENYNEDCATIVKESVLKGTPTLDGKLDAIYTQSLTVKLDGPAASYSRSNGAEETTATGTVYALYDDNYVYVFFDIVDKTLMANDPAYVLDHPHPHLNDAVEWRIGDDLEDHFAPYDGSNDAHHLFYADAFNTRFTCYEESMGDDVEKMKHVTVFDKATGKYTVEAAIPTIKAFQEGEMIQFNFQIDDLQDLETEAMTAIGLGPKPVSLVDFYCGGAAKGGAVVEEPKVEEPKVEEPKVEEPKVEEPKVEEPKVEEPKVEEPKVEEPKVEEPKVEEPKVEEPVEGTEEPVEGTEEPVEGTEEPVEGTEEPVEGTEEPVEGTEEPKVEEPKVEEPKEEGSNLGLIIAIIAAVVVVAVVVIVVVSKKKK
jgi:hypothetical protein